MAVRIQTYTQQTSTPNSRVSAGNPIAVGGPDLGGALMQLAGGIANVHQQREQGKENIASAWAADELAKVQSEAPRMMDKFKLEAGEGGAGVIDKTNEWIEQRQTELLANAPTDASRKFLQDRLRDYRVRLDLTAYDYEQNERTAYIGNKFDASIDSGASAAASNPNMAPTIIAEIRSAIHANTTLTPEAKRLKERKLIDTVSYADVLGDMERDPYAARNNLRARVGIGADATGGDVSMMMESAVKALDRLENDEGFVVPPDMRQEAITVLMGGGTIGVDKETGEPVFARKGGEVGEVPFSYAALDVPRAVELLSRADAEIARRETAARQGNEFGRQLFRQEVNDLLAAAEGGEPVTLPSYARMELYLGEEEAIIMQQKLLVAQSAAGELAAMDGQSNDELAAIVATKPTGTENRQFRDAAYSVKAQRATAIIAARNDDPGGYVLGTSDPVQTAFGIYQAELKRVSELGPRATGNDILAAQRAQSNYIMASRDEQRRLGVREPMLPKAYIGEVVQRFSDGIKTDSAPQAAAELETLAISMLDTPKAIEQIAAKVGDVGMFAIDGVDGMTVKRLQNAMSLPEDKLKELLPAGVSWGQIEESVATEFAPLMTTFVAQGDNDAASRYLKAGQALTAEYLREGDNLNAASRKAYDALFASRNVANRTYRIPLTLPIGGKMQAVNPNQVETGLALFIRDMTPADMAFPVDPGFTEQESFERNMRTVRAQSRWVNNQTGTGVILMGRDGPQRRPDGSNIEVLFEEAIKLTTENPETVIQIPTKRPRTLMEMR